MPDNTHTLTDSEQLAARILDALPQTQCQRCGYADCAAYAQAIANGEAAINQCPPGGAEGIRRLAALTRQPVQALNPAHGTEEPRGVAWIDENWCIGCTLCIKACPVDCIIGSNKVMHTIVESECTGCELCVAACPVDCIHMENISGHDTGWAAWSQAQAQAAREQYEQHKRRDGASKKKRRRPAHIATVVSDSRKKNNAVDPERKRAAVAAALARARQRRHSA